MTTETKLPVADPIPTQATNVNSVAETKPVEAAPEKNPEKWYFGKYAKAGAEAASNFIDEHAGTLDMVAGAAKFGAQFAPDQAKPVLNAIATGIAVAHATNSAITLIRSSQNKSIENAGPENSLENKNHLEKGLSIYDNHKDTLGHIGKIAEVGQALPVVGNAIGLTKSVIDYAATLQGAYETYTNTSKIDPGKHLGSLASDHALDAVKDGEINFNKTVLTAGAFAAGYASQKLSGSKSPLSLANSSQNINTNTTISSPPSIVDTLKKQNSLLNGPPSTVKPTNPQHVQAMSQTTNTMGG